MNSTLEWIGFLQNDFSSNQQSHHFNWGYAAFCSALVGLSGLVPIFILPNFQNNNNSSTKVSDNKDDKDAEEPPEDLIANSKYLRWMLSFAVGGLLGDVFFHLLPEAMQSVKTHEDSTSVGLCIIFGLLAFTIVEKIMQNFGLEQASGYLNLVANCVDNFNHGLAVGGAFIISNKVGFMTTACILIHEIPHEVGDFAILIKSGFSKSQAAKAQFSTALVGILGAFVALALDSVVDWMMAILIVPFTCGGFLHIALVSVLPDLMESKDIQDCFRIISGIVLGIVIMYGASMI